MMMKKNREGSKVMKNKIYAAYGSNMNIEQMMNRCPGAKVIGVGEVANYKLTFRGIGTGVANIERSKEGTVPIVLWEVTARCEKALDIYEGYPRLYVKSDIEVATNEGLVQAMAYVMCRKYEGMPAKPSHHYLDIISEGYADNKIALIALDEAVAENLQELSFLN